MRFTAACALIALAVLACAVPADAHAKKGTIHACYAKKGPGKGTMRFVRGKKCHHGEKSLKWKKRGKRGPAGQIGPAGPVGPAGQSNSDAIDALQAQLDAQASRIAALEAQVAQLSGQFDAFKTLACGQLALLTTQSNALGVALDGIGLGGTIPLGLTLLNPGAPTALPAFSC